MSEHRLQASKPAFLPNCLLLSPAQANYTEVKKQEVRGEGRKRRIFDLDDILQFGMSFENIILNKAILRERGKRRILDLDDIL
ncbi:hypothetical protein SCA6_010979 [Theobroma cacao]